MQAMAFHRDVGRRAVMAERRPKASYPEFRAWLADVMRQKAWNQSDAARAFDVDQSMIGRWLAGETRPSPEIIWRIAERLPTDLFVLMGKAGYLPPLADEETHNAELIAKLRSFPLDQWQYETLAALLDLYRRRATTPMRRRSVNGTDENVAGSAGA